MTVLKHVTVLVFVVIFLTSISIPSQASTESPTVSPGTIPAFPGAEGFGKYSIGGRGGQIIEVTNLNDSGPGSLRAAIDTSGPRIVIFRVSGIIELATGLQIKQPFITIAGQTAPEPGITIRNRPSSTEAALRVKADHVIIQYLRIRPGPPQTTAAVDALGVAAGQYIIVDHTSMSWANDEVVNVWYDASDVTIQWSIISEGLAFTNHPDNHIHSDALLIGDKSTRISVHHNLLAHNGVRNPRVTGGDVDFVNNIIYNTIETPSRFFDLSSVAMAHCNYVGNYIKRGVNSTWNTELKITPSTSKGVRCYVSGNLGPDRLNDTLPDSLITDKESKPFIVNTRYDFPLVNTTTASTAYNDVLAKAGATLPHRDAIDARVTLDVIKGTGKIIDNPSQVGGWSVFAAAGASTPIDIDSDHDGMANDWEIQNNFNPNDPADGPQDADQDGYTNVEEYLHSLQPKETTLPLPAGSAIPANQLFLPFTETEK